MQESTPEVGGKKKKNKNKGTSASNRLLGRRVVSETHMGDVYVNMLPFSLEELVQRLFDRETGVPTRDRKYRKKVYRNCCTGTYTHPFQPLARTLSPSLLSFPPLPPNLVN